MMKSKSIKPVQRQNSKQLVKSLITLLPLKLVSDQPFTQEFAASLIGCHRHWFRNHKKRYDIITGEIHLTGKTPLEILEVFEVERSRDKVQNPVEVALQNADAKYEDLKKENFALKEKIVAQRRALHIFSKHRHELGITDKALLRELLE